MSTITREHIANLIEFNSEGSDCQANAEQWEVHELARIALASLEAEAVAWRYRHHNGLAPSNWRCVDIEIECNMAPNYQRQALFAAPPSPVAPDLKELEAILDWILMLPCPTPKATHFAKRLAVVIDTCRAAMLKGADGNSPVIPDGYALVPIEPTTNQWAAGMQAFDSGMDKVTRVYKAMLTAAPQQVAE